MSAVYLVEGQRGKRCSGLCGEVKPLDAFYARRGRGDGYQSQCKECQKARVPAYREANRERVARWSRDLKRRLSQDPEWCSTRRAYNREYMRARRGTAPENVRPIAGYVLVDSAPVREAVRAADLSWSEIGHRAGMSEQQVRVIFQRAKISSAKARSILDVLGLSPSEVGL